MDERVPINGLPPGYATSLGLGLPPHPLATIGSGTRAQQGGSPFAAANSPYTNAGVHHQRGLGSPPTSGVATSVSYGLATRPPTSISSQAQQQQQPLYVPALLAPSPISAAGLSSKLDYPTEPPPPGLAPGAYASVTGLSSAGLSSSYTMPPFGGAPVLYHPSPTAPMAGYISSSYATQQALLNAQAASSLALPPYYGHPATPSPSPLYSPAPSIDGNSEGLHAKLLSQTSTGQNQTLCPKTNLKTNLPLHPSPFLPATSTSTTTVFIPGQLISPLHGGSFQSMTPGVTPGVTPSPAPSTPATPTLQKPTPTKAVPGGLNPLFSAEHLFGSQTQSNHLSAQSLEDLQPTNLHSGIASSGGPQRGSLHSGLTNLQTLQGQTTQQPGSAVHPTGGTIVKRERASTSPVVKREGPSPLGVPRANSRGSTPTPGTLQPMSTLPAPIPVHPSGPVLIKPKPEMPAKPKAILAKPQPVMATALSYPYRPMMKMEAPSVASPLSHTGLPAMLGLPGMPGLSGLTGGLSGHPSALSHPSVAFSAHQSVALSHQSAALSHMTSLSYSSPLCHPGLTTAASPHSHPSASSLSSHPGLSSTSHLSSSAGLSAPSSPSTLPAPPGAAAAAHAAFAVAGYHPAYAAAAAAAAFHQQHHQSLAASGQQENARQGPPPTAGAILMPQPRNSHSMPLRLPEPSICPGGGSFESHLSSLSKVITATFGQPEQMSINHQKLAQISQQSVMAAVVQQHKELEKRKEREQKDREKKKEKKDRTSCGSTSREVIVIKEESQDDSKHDVFRQVVSVSAAGVSLGSFGHLTGSLAAASIASAVADLHCSRSRASTPATVIDKGDSKSSSATSLATSVASSAGGHTHRERERGESPAYREERSGSPALLAVSAPTAVGITSSATKKKRKSLLMPNRQDNKDGKLQKSNKESFSLSTVGTGTGASRGTKDVYSFESEGDDTIASIPAGRTVPALPQFRSKPAFPFGSTSSGSHRKRALVADEVAQTKFPAVTESCARATVYSRKGAYDMFDFLASRHRRPPRGEHDSDDDSDDDDHSEEVSMRQRRIDKDLHMVMQFYSLKETARHTVGVYRSKIHRRGVFAKRVIEAGEMVIEYSGELIRAVLTDKRENNYKSRGIDCYMFKIDEDEVVDATMHGNAARFINHSCDPNCYSKCIEIFGKKHIVIYSQKRIRVGEELTYDYKFPKEEVKVPCTCGARKCRRYLN
ncbi:hypothetical protein BIW11_05355 [Tropilaelaps mercedesae]|uniref:Histone-lysine N-methyltransferase n=1 Tax=Tropilaelaps mercedesae TaxID=418985 RepID=A0A1V9Y2T4_9ACAR|nr:hypothetical protein BIW11_05355 [Tropilaelaps mercedesae]